MQQHSWIKPILEKIDMEWQTVTQWLAKKKQRCKSWWNETNDAISFHCNNIPNWLKVFIAGIFSLVLLIVILYLIIPRDSDNILKTEALIGANGFWTLLTLLISSPVAFIIWHFRDQNVTQQIENARKDTNLKEFQKLAEWVSGIHLIEDKVVEKTSFEEKQENSEANSHKKEITREYTEPAENLAISTYSKKEGAVGLQISAVYNLLPFYRGDHGESFKKPALNLLTSAWLAMQQKELSRYDNENIKDEEREQAIQEIRKNSNSPLAIAITRVLLSLNTLGKPCLLDYPEVLADLCLAGMNFRISGVDKNISDIFKQEIVFRGNLVGADLTEIDLSKAHLSFADLSEAYLIGADLSGADLIGAKLSGADLKFAKLNGADLSGADLSGADLRGADLIRAKLSGANLRLANLSRANLSRTDLRSANLSRAKLSGADLSGADLSGANLSGADLRGANLTKANLIGADLRGADLSFAKLNKTILIDVDLTAFSHDNVDLSTAILEEATENSA